MSFVEIDNWSLCVRQTQSPALNVYSAPEMWVPIETVHLQGRLTDNNQWVNTSAVKSVQLTDHECKITTASGSVYKLVGSPAEEYKQFLAMEKATHQLWDPSSQWNPQSSYNLVNFLINASH